MISHVNGSVAQSVYANNTSETKTNKNVGTQNAKDTDKVEQLKEAIDSGKYKIDIPIVAEKMADELL